MVRIAQAGLNEWGGTHGGEAGNQLRTDGKLDGELNIREWYNKSWEIVIRPKDPKKAEIIAKTAYECVLNKNIGYDQSQRQTLYYEMKGNKWDASKVRPCETDCSSLWCVCANAAGIPIDPVVYTGTMKEFAEKSGAFTILTAKKYLTSSKYLKRGDALVKPYDHAVIVLDNGEGEADYVATGDVYIRKTPITGATLGIVPTGGFVTKEPNTYPWIRGTYNGVTGWISTKYLKEIGE